MVLKGVGKCLGKTIFLILLLLALAVAFLYYAYQVVDEGELYMPNAPGKVEIVREADSGIVHITADTYESVAYAQGFAHAQTRLWQLERTRRVIRGELSELFGPDTIKIDLMMKQLGLARLGAAAFEHLNEEQQATLEAYADGINDCVFGTSFWDEGRSGKLLPPEFYAFGLNDLSQWRPWEPADTLSLLKYKSFYLSWNWMNDLARESLRQKHPDFADMVDQMNPYKSEDMIDLVTIIEDDDLIQHGQWSDTTLIERYHAALDHLKTAQPELKPSVPSEQIRAALGLPTETEQRRAMIADKEAATVRKPQNQLDQEAAAERAEKERLEAERLQKEELKRKEDERVKAERLAEAEEKTAEQARLQAEKQKLADEQAQAERLAEAEIKAAELREIELQEQARLEAERQEAEQRRLLEEAEAKFAAEKAEELAKGRIQQHPSNVSTEPRAVKRPPPADYSDPARQANPQKSDAQLEEELSGLIGHSTASNSWVISGEHTENGMPLLSSDPHLGSTIPSFWSLQHLRWGDDGFVSGASLVGMPGIALGRTNHIVWGLTAGIVDNSDLWEEEFNEAETHYLVDGEWRELAVRHEVLKVKGQEDLDLVVKSTHRGPIIDSEVLRFTADLLFGVTVAKFADSSANYSFGWGGAYPGDSSLDLLDAVKNSKSVPEVFEKVEKASDEKGYTGIAVNLSIADNLGNIAYQMAVPMPRRKDLTPYLGCRVLDGRKSDFDWESELIPLRDLPRSINPKKGFLSNANNRQAPDNASQDFGATHMSTGRAVRIDERIREGIAAGHKFTADDMISIQLDTVDVFARRMVPTLVQLAEQSKADLPKDEQLDLIEAVHLYRDFDGNMAEESIGASLHMHINLAFHKSLFHKQEPGDSDEAMEDRLLLTDTYAFVQTYMRMMFEVVEQGADSHFQVFCEQAHPEYKGDNHCAYNVAKAFVEAKRLLETKISKRPEDWTWRNVLTRQYANMPFSSTPLRFFFHREVPYAGNTHTPNVSGIQKRGNRDSVVFQSNHVAAFKMVVNFANDKQEPDDAVSKWLIDTGMNGNPFQGHYFDLNSDFIYGRLRDMKVGKKGLDGTPTKKLVIRPRRNSSRNDAADGDSVDKDASAKANDDEL